MKIYLSPSNQIHNTYAYGNTVEAIQCNKINNEIVKQLKKYNIEVKTATYSADYIERAKEAKKFGADYYLAIHTNAGGNGKAVGAVGIYNGIYDNTFVKMLISELNLICPYKSNRSGGGLMDGLKAFNNVGYAEIREPNKYKINSSIIEINFHDNPQIAEWIVKNIDLIALTIVKCIKLNFRLKLKDTNLKDEALTSIVGKAEATKQQVKSYMQKLNIDNKYIELVDIYYKIGEIENIRADIAIAQSLLETGNFKFGGDVKPNQNNFAGLGATGGIPGNSFESAEDGITAQIQHLKAYATMDVPKTELKDIRYRYVKKGAAPYVEWLGIKENPTHTGWASGENYGYKIINILYNILKEKKEEEKQETEEKSYENKNYKRYKTIDDIDNKQYKEFIQSLIDKGWQGRGNGIIDLDEDMVRLMMIINQYLR